MWRDVRTLAHSLGGIAEPSRLSSTFDLMEEASPRYREDLIDRHWTEMSRPFTQTIALGQPTSQDFST